MSKNTPKRKAKPRPQKPPFRPLRPDQKLRPGIGPVQKRLIGQFIVEWANVEAALDDLIWRILGLDEDDGRTLTKRSDAATKITILRSIAPRYLDGKNLDSLLDALDDANTMRDDRNFVIHGIWGTLHPEGVPMAMSLRAKSEPGEIATEGFPPERLRHLTRETMKTRDTLVRLWRSLEPSPDISK